MAVSTTRAARLRRLRALLDEQGLGNWSIHLHDWKARLGSCDFARKEIGISRHHIAHDPHEEVLDTFVHEVAHALAGPRAGHGKKWKARIVALGGMPRAKASRSQLAGPMPLWTGQCPGCDQRIFRHRLTGRGRDLACAHCCAGRYDPAYRFRWQRTRPAHWQQLQKQATGRTGRGHAR